MSNVSELLNKQKQKTVSIQVKVPEDLHAEMGELLRLHSLNWQEILMASILDIKSNLNSSKRKAK